MTADCLDTICCHSCQCERYKEAVNNITIYNVGTLLPKKYNYKKYYLPVDGINVKWVYNRLGPNDWRSEKPIGNYEKREAIEESGIECKWLPIKTDNVKISHREHAAGVLSEVHTRSAEHSTLTVMQPLRGHSVRRTATEWHHTPHLEPPTMETTPETRFPTVQSTMGKFITRTKQHLPLK